MSSKLQTSCLKWNVWDFTLLYRAFFGGGVQIKTGLDMRGRVILLLHYSVESRLHT